MKPPNLAGWTIVLLAAAGLVCSSARAYFLDDIGLTAFRAVTTNLDGRGITVAQPEALYVSTNDFEVDPSVPGQPAALFTYISALGTANVFPNSVGAASGHAGAVGAYFYGPAYGIATNVAHVDSYEADYFITGLVQTLTAIPDPVVNQSFADSDTNNESDYDPIYDNYAAQYNTLFITGAGDGGPVQPPSTCYNGISVGAYLNYNNTGSYGPTPVGGRCKPDITALSQNTSITAPMVSGAAALLMQAALRGDGGGNTNAAFDLRTIKALLLNGAVKPLSWTNSKASPLDLRYGAGVLNILNSYEQLTGGRHTNLVFSSVPQNSAHPPTGATNTISVLSGWDFNTNTSSMSDDNVAHYYFNVSNSLGQVRFTATATLVWNRHYNANYQFTTIGINNLNLFLYNCANGNIITCSTSMVDNVEHFYQTNLAQGRYDLQVWKAGGGGIVSAAEPYALAFEFVPQPTLSITGGTNPALTWPVYPADFFVAARTNLLTGAWSTNGFSIPAITNGLDNIPLGTTNPAQFFRLQKHDL